MKKLTIFLSLIFAYFLLSPNLVLAANEDPPSIQIQKQDQDRLNDPQGPAERNQTQNVLSNSDKAGVEAKDGHQEQMQAKSEQVCEKLQARVQNRLNQYEENKEKYHKRYYGIQKKVENLADKLEEKGCDVSQIRADTVTLEEHIEKFAAAFRNFNEHMKSAKSHACGETDSNFRGQVGQARTQVTAMQQAARQLHNYIFNTLKPHLRQTAESCKAQTQNQNQTQTQTQTQTGGNN